VPEAPLRVARQFTGGQAREERELVPEGTIEILRPRQMFQPSLWDGVRHHNLSPGVGKRRAIVSRPSGTRGIRLSKRSSRASASRRGSAMRRAVEDSRAQAIIALSMRFIMPCNKLAKCPDPIIQVIL